MKFKKEIKGFTLLELTIAVAIIGILAAIAYPAYNGYVESTNRKAAVAEMLRISQLLERQYTTNNGSYQGANLGTAVSDANAQLQGYIIQAPAIQNNGQSYTITAVLQSGGGDTSCGSLTIDSNGSYKSSTNANNCFR